MDFEEFASLQLDKPMPDVRNEEQLKKHTLDANLEKRPIDRALHLLTKGDEIQRLSIIQSLPSLLATDTQQCMSRVVPKMQQSLATASTEFHIAASSTFKTILEQKLVSHNVFSQTFLQSILNSLESRDPVICHAWLETLLDVIELLPVEVIRTQILPLTISKGQLSQPVYSRITCSRLLGKICTRFDSSLIQKEVLPTVHSLCQDVNSEVRASICLQLRFVAEGLGAESVKPALLPSLVELASDEESNVRCSSVQTIVYLLPHLQEDTIKTIIVPLVKKLCENAVKSDDNVICVIAQDFGKLVLGLEKCLLPAEKTWFLKYYQQVAQMGILSVKKESKPHLPFINTNPADDEKYVECRRLCAFNLPAMFIFVSNSPEDVDSLLLTFNSLASDHYYMVRRTVACGIHVVAKVLSPKSGRIKGELIKLLRDDSEEVLQGLVPHISLTLNCLAESQTIGIDRVDSTLMEIGRALLKCETEIASTHNWRLAALMHSQLEVLPKYFPSDFIYSYFVPMAFSRILHARPIPVRLAAGTLFLYLLRYNVKPMQRVELRNRIYTDLANNPDCYVRMMFVRMMIEAIEIFSSPYFKEHFFTPLLALAEDPVANIRVKVVSLLPQLKSQLWRQTDKKLLTALESTVRHLASTEKDRDVITTLTNVVQRLEEIEVKYEGQPVSSKLSKYEAEDARKLDEEKRLSGMGNKALGTPLKKAGIRKSGDGTPAKTLPQALPKDAGSPSRQAGESLKTRIQLTQPWERIVHSNSNISTTHINFDNGSWSDYLSQKSQWSKLAMAEALFASPSTSEQEYKNELSDCCSSHNIDADHSKFRNQPMHAHQYNPSSDFAKSFLPTLMKDDKQQESPSNLLLTRDYSRESSTNIAGKDRAPNLAALRALTSEAHYNSCWAFRSMPEIPVMLSDDEFLMDTGIRITTQFSSPQGSSKIPHLQDFIFARRRTSNIDRSRRASVNFDKAKPKRIGSVDYDVCIKGRTNGTDQGKGIRTSIDYEEGLRQRSLIKENSDDQQLGKVDSRKDKVYLVSYARTRFGFATNQERSVDEKIKKNSMILDKDKPKVVHTKCTPDRTKRHSAIYNMKPPEVKDSKLNLKRHSLEVTDYTPNERLGRALRRYSTLDVNHNQGLSKIPLRSFVSRSRTAPATRASSPVHMGSRFIFDSANREDTECSTSERRLTRFSSSDEEVDKLCRMLSQSQTTPSSRSKSPKARDSRLPIRLLMKEL